MEPRIQYAKTSDGVSIAYYAMGEGHPLVYMSTWPYTHLQLEWQYPIFVRLYELLLKEHRLIRFDGRGSGLSERNVADYSLEARLLDLNSVVERLGLEKFDLLGHQSSGPVASLVTFRPSPYNVGRAARVRGPGAAVRGAVAGGGLGRPLSATRTPVQV